MTNSKNPAWFSILLLIALAGCGRAPVGQATPSMPPLPYLSLTPSRTLLSFTTPTPPLTNGTPTFAPSQPRPSQAPVVLKPGPTLATPAQFSWPTPLPRQTRTFPVSALTPLAPGARLEALGELARLGRGTLLAFTFSSDGRWLGLATRSGVELYDARTYKELRFIATLGEVARLAFSPDGSLLAAADRDSRVTLYNPSSGEKLRLLDNGALGTPLSLSFFAGGSLLSVGASSELSVIWETATGKMVHRWITSGNAAMAASDDGVLMASSNWNGSIYLWTLADGRSPGRLWADSEILAMQFAPDGRNLVVGYGDNNALIWQLDGGKVLHTLRGHTDRVVSVAVSPDSSLIATASWDDTIRLWDMDSGEPLHTLEGHTGRIVQIVFSADGRELASYSEDGRFQLWTVPTGLPAQTLEDFAPPGNAAFSPDGGTVLTGAQDGWLRWWDPSGTLLRECLADPAGISALQVSPGGEWVATGGTDGPVRLWEMGTGRLVAEFDGSEGWVNSLVFSPDGHWLAASTPGGEIRTWDLTSGRPGESIQTDEKAVLRLAFSPDGRSLAAGALSGSVVLWRLDSEQPARVLREKGPFISALAFSPDGQTLAAGGDEKIIWLWRLALSSYVQTVGSQTNEGLTALVYSPDGQVIASSFWDRTLRFYSAVSGSLLRSFDLPAAARQLSISPDGRRLALSLDDGTVRIWGIK